MAGKMGLHRLLGRLLGDERGANTIEFALSMLLLLTVLFAILDFSRAMYSYEFVTYAAQEGARYAIVRGGDFSSACNTSAPPNFTMSFDCNAAGADVQNYVQSLALPGITQSKIAVTTNWPASTPDCTPSKTTSCSACSGSKSANSQGCAVNIQVSYTFNFMGPFMPKAGVTFSGASQKIIQQ